MNIEIPALLILAASAFFTTVCIVIFRAPAQKFGLNSRTGGRRMERRAVPLVGGAAIFLSVVLAIVFGTISTQLLILLALSTPVFVVGALDDTFELHAPKKLPVEIACALIWVFHLTADDLALVRMGMPVLAAQLLTAFWIVGVTNAMNLSDGIDGLTAGLGAAVSAILIFTCPSSAFVPLWIAMIGAMLGFLPFNYSNKFRTFLGDSGSLWIGFILACTASGSSFGSTPFGDVCIILSLFCYSEFDTLYAVVRRLRDSLPVMTGDHLHIHHHLRSLGFESAASSLLIVIANVTVAVSFVLWASTGGPFAPVTTVVAAVALFFVIVRAATTSRARMHRLGTLLIEQFIENKSTNVVSINSASSTLVASLDMNQMFNSIPLLSDDRVDEVAGVVGAVALQFESRLENKHLLIFADPTNASSTAAGFYSQIAKGLQLRRKKDGSIENFVTLVEAPAEVNRPVKAA